MKKLEFSETQFPLSTPNAPSVTNELDIFNRLQSVKATGKKDGSSLKKRNGPTTRNDMIKQTAAKVAKKVAKMKDAALSGDESAQRSFPNHKSGKGIPVQCATMAAVSSGGGGDRALQGVKSSLRHRCNTY